MSRIVFVSAVTVAVLISAFTQAEPPVAPPPPPSQPEPRAVPLGPGDKMPLPSFDDVRIQKWEYRVLDRSDLDELSGIANTEFVGQHLEAGINKLGADGWELVTIEPNIGALNLSRYIFKRSGSDSPQPPRPVKAL